MKFAFLIMGDYDSQKDRGEISGGQARMIGVASVSEAAEIAAWLAEEGIGCIELCGAFGEEGARKVIEATGNRIPVGYVTHLPEQEEVYRKAFSN